MQGPGLLPQTRSLRVLAPYLSLTVLVIGALVASFAVISQRASRQAEALRMTQAVATGLSDQWTRALQGIDLLMLDIAGRRRAGMERPLTPELPRTWQARRGYSARIPERLGTAASRVRV